MCVYVCVCVCVYVDMTYVFCIDCSHRLRDFDILLHNEASITTGTSDPTHRVCHRHNCKLAATQLSVTCAKGEDYLSRYVMVKLWPRDPDFLTLCEVEVYAGRSVKISDLPRKISGMYMTAMVHMPASQEKWFTFSLDIA